MNDKLYIGNKAVDMDVSTAFVVDRVELWINDVMFFRSPNVSQEEWEQMTGYVLKANCPFGTQAICDSIYARVNGFEYKPMVVKSASVDPCVELGDAVTVGGEYGYVSVLNSKLNARNETDVENPDEGELQQEYEYQDAVQVEQARQGVRIKQSVTFEDLSTQGATVINGGNITTGSISANRIKGDTLTLGGANNVNGTLKINNGNNEEIGTWTNTGIVIKDTPPSSASYRDTALKVVDKNNANIGAYFGLWNWQGLTGNQPIVSLMDGTNENHITSSQIALTSNAQPIVMLQSGNNKAEMNATPQTQSGVVTRTGGRTTSFTHSMHTWGRMATLTIHLANGANTGTGATDVVFSGTLSNYKPVSVITSATNWFEWQIIGKIDTSGNITISMLNKGAVVAYRGDIDISFTYLY